MKVLKYLTKCFSREGFSQNKSNKKLRKSLIWWTDSKQKPTTEVRAKNAFIFSAEHSNFNSLPGFIGSLFFKVCDTIYKQIEYDIVFRLLAYTTVPLTHISMKNKLFIVYYVISFHNPYF